MWCSHDSAGDCVKSCVRMTLFGFSELLQELDDDGSCNESEMRGTLVASHKFMSSTEASLSVTYLCGCGVYCF